ncbi:MAG: PAS domain-containing protein [Campylobacterales bacterium]|nr:PAS domain-containing protein [Campylobacterales bacterium]
MNNNLTKELNLEDVLLDTLPNPVYYKDTKGRFIRCNKAFANLVNASKEEIIGKVAYEYFPKDVADRHKDIDKKIIETLGKNEDEVIFPTLNNEIKYYILNKAVYLNNDGDIGGIVCIMNDITQSMKDKNLLIQQSKFAEMGEMIASVAHQWNEPLVELSAQIQRIQIYYDMNNIDKKKVSDFVNDSMIQIKYMSDTLFDFRSFLKPSTVKEEFYLHKAIDEIFEIVGKQIFYFNIDVNFEYKNNNDIKIYAYENELKQVLLNLINNAKNKINSLDENKKFRGLISINTYKDEDSIHIDVKDNAGSIPEEIINHIFEPFFTTKANGTGFGLYMAKIIIEDKMSGSISVKNEEQNVVFSIKIPIRNK